MSEIPKEALAKAAELVTTTGYAGWTERTIGNDQVGTAFARYIADVSEKAGKAFDLLGGVDGAAEARGLLLSLILPNPEDDLLKEAREIVAEHWRGRGEHGFAERALDGRCDKHADVSCTFAALKKGRG